MLYIACWFVPAPAVAEDAGVCARTPQVSTALVTATGADGCGGVTVEQLRDVTSLDLSQQGIDTLRSGDFGDLARLETLDLSGNALASLPSDVFDELYSLTVLRLDDNDLTALPGALFDRLLLLETLGLGGNSLAALPDGYFDDLSRFKGAHVGQQKHGMARLRQFLTEKAPGTVEQFVAALPQLHKERFVFVYNSDGLGAEHVSMEHPRVVTPGADGRFIFAWMTAPDAPSQLRHSVEFLVPEPEARSWNAGIIDFSDGTPRIAHPESCQGCHGTFGKPLWGPPCGWAPSPTRARAS